MFEFTDKDAQVMAEALSSARMSVLGAERMYEEPSSLQLASINQLVGGILYPYAIERGTTVLVLYEQFFGTLERAKRYNDILDRVLG